MTRFNRNAPFANCQSQWNSESCVIGLDTLDGNKLAALLERYCYGWVLLWLIVEIVKYFFHWPVSEQRSALTHCFPHGPVNLWRIFNLGRNQWAVKVSAIWSWLSSCPCPPFYILATWNSDIGYGPTWSREGSVLLGTGLWGRPWCGPCFNFSLGFKELGT